MIESKDFDIVGSFNNLPIQSIDAERTVNLFEYIDQNGKKPKSLIYTSGLGLSGYNLGVASGGVRAQYVFNNVQYFVVGQSVFSATTGGTITLIGTITNTSAGYVGVEANTFQVIFVDGTNGYIYDTISGEFTQITDPAFPTNPIDVTALDGFFIVANGGTPNFNLSSLNQGLIWGPDNPGTKSTFTMAATSSHIVISYATGASIANYQVGTPIVFSGASLPSELAAGVTYYVVAIINSTTIQVSATDGGSPITSTAGGSGNLTNNGILQQGSITTHPGNIMACRTLHRRLFLFSQFFTEVWENAGIGTTLPFRRNNSLLIEFGTPCVGSIAVSFDIMVFLSQSRDGLGPVVQVSGTQSFPISTKALDNQLSDYNSVNHIADCRAFLIKENAIIFYRMNFTAANHTWVYNVTLSNPENENTRLWHEEQVLTGNRHPAQTHAYFNGVNYVGDYQSPIIYILDDAIYTNNGVQIPRIRVTKPFFPPGQQRIRVDRLQIDLLQGNSAIFTEDTGNLFVYLSISKDGGQTFGNTIAAPMGALGQRTFRTVWRKLGTSKRGQALVFKFTFTQAIPFVILGASWVYEILPE